MLLEDKIAVVTGSSSGTGKDIAELFAKEGAKVIITSNTTIQTGEEAAHQICVNGGIGEYINADLSTEKGVSHLFQSVRKKYDNVDILINNAGRTFNIPFSGVDALSLEQDIRVNLISTILCSKYILELMNKEGWIINTSSIRGIDCVSRPGIMGYCAAKSGINSFTKSLAMELAPKIFVNAVAPGFVWTGYMDNVSDELKELWRKNIPIKRFIEP